MLDKRYFVGLEGEEQVKIWSVEGEEDCGMILWRGYFDTILEGCFHTDFSSHGLLKCYYNQNGFYDDRWEVEYPDIVLQELRKFDKDNIKTTSNELIKACNEIIMELIVLIEGSIKNIWRPINTHGNILTT